MRRLRSIAVLVFLLAACEPGPDVPPASAPPSTPGEPSADPDLSFPGGGRILFIPNVSSYSGHFGIVDADGSTIYLGDERFSFPYWDPSAPTRLLTVPFDGAQHRRPRVRALEIAGDDAIPAGSWPGSPSFTFLSLDGGSIAFTPFRPSGRLRPGIVRVIDRATGRVKEIRSGTLVPTGWTPADELIAVPWLGGPTVRWDPRTDVVSRFGSPQLSEAVWDPSGTRFAGRHVTRGRNVRTEVVIGDLRGHLHQRVLVGRRDVEVPTWSPDGGRIASIVRGVGRAPHRRSSLHVYDLTERVDSIVARPVSVAFWASWSPDGNWLLLDDWTRDRWLFVAADGSDRVPYPRLGGFPRWCCPSSPPISVPIPVS